MYSQSEIIEYLAGKKDFFLENYHITNLGFFGSYARNEQNEKSDLDLIVDFLPDTKDLYGIEFTLKKEIRKDLKLKVDVCHRKYINKHFREIILSETVYV